MAGSYNHAVTDGGALLDNDKFVGMIENLGDAYEMAEEMYGMIWWLAMEVRNSDDVYDSPFDVIEDACIKHKEGLEIAKRYTS